MATSPHSRSSRETGRVNRLSRRACHQLGIECGAALLVKVPRPKDSSEGAAGSEERPAGLAAPSRVEPNRWASPVIACRTSGFNLERDRDANGGSTKVLESRCGTRPATRPARDRTDLTGCPISHGAAGHFGSVGHQPGKTPRSPSNRSIQRPPMVGAWSVNRRHAMVSVGVGWRYIASSEHLSGPRLGGLAGSPKAGVAGSNHAGGTRC